MVKKIKRKILLLKEIIVDYLILRKINLSLIDVIKVKFNSKSFGKTILFGEQIKITDSFWYLYGLKEIFIQEVYKFKSRKNNPKIIDCGANIGLSIIFFKRLFPEAKIIGFEPDDDIYKVLEYNLSKFKLNDVKILRKAIWINEEPLFFKKNKSVGGHLVQEQSNNVIKVETVRLKDILNDQVDFLKIDIEGSEYDVLNDCKNQLNKVENIFVEYHSFHENPQMLSELLSILKNAGFKIYVKEAWENMKNPFIEQKGYYFDLQLNIFGYRRS